MLVLYTDTHTFTHLCAYTQTYTCAHGHTYIQLCVCVCACGGNMCIHTLTQSDIHTHTQKNTHKEGAYFIRVWVSAKNGAGRRRRAHVDLWVLPTVFACTPKLT
jgi:hypothetical protein